MRHTENFTKEILSMILSFIWWFVLISTILSTLSIAHKLNHLYTIHSSNVKAAEKFQERWCVNLTNVEETRTHHLCEENKQAMNMSPFWESVIEVSETLKLCSKESGDIHEIHDHRKSLDGSSHNQISVSNHCDHAHYIGLGVLLGVIITLILWRCCLNKISDDSISNSNPNFISSSSNKHKQD